MKSHSKGQCFWSTPSLFVFCELTKNTTTSSTSVYLNLILIVTSVLIKLLLAMFVGPNFFPSLSQIFLSCLFFSAVGVCWLLFKCVLLITVGCIKRMLKVGTLLQNWVAKKLSANTSLGGIMGGPGCETKHPFPSMEQGFSSRSCTLFSRSRFSKGSIHDWGSLQ